MQIELKGIKSLGRELGRELMNQNFFKWNMYTDKNQHFAVAKYT